MLKGLEKENVLKTLESGNIDIIVKDMTFGMKVEIQSKYLSFNPQGILLVSKSFGTLDKSVGNQISVQFYVNQVGYCFDSTLQDRSQGLAIVIPKNIGRVKSSSTLNEKSFRAKLFYFDENKKTVTIPCLVPDSYSLLSRPVWNDVPASVQDECRKLMTQFVNQRKTQSPSLIGNGMHLLPIACYLCDPEMEENLDTVHGTQIPLDLIYIDDEKIVFGKRKYAQELELESDYTLSLEVRLSAFLTRSILIGCTVSDIYAASSPDLECYLCTITQIKAEDERFIAERMK